MEVPQTRKNPRKTYPIFSLLKWNYKPYSQTLSPKLRQALVEASKQAAVNLAMAEAEARPGLIVLRATYEVPLLRNYLENQLAIIIGNFP